MPDPNLTHLVFVLDRSGSMEPLRQMAVDGFNEFLAKQKGLPGSTTVTLTQFSDEVWTTMENIPLAEAHFDQDAYGPSGNTALFDAVARTIDRVGHKLAALPERIARARWFSPFSPMAKKTPAAVSQPATFPDGSTINPSTMLGNFCFSVPRRGGWSKPRRWGSNQPIRRYLKHRPKGWCRPW